MRSEVPGQSQPRVIEIAFAYPEKSYSSFGGRAHRPPAEIILVLEDKERRTRLVATCVAHACQRKQPSLPRDLDAISSFLDATDRTCCMQQLVKMLARRDHGSAESREKLIAYGFAEDSVDRVLERARELRMIDDGRIARTYAERLMQKGWGRAMVGRKLRARGFCAEEIDRALEMSGSLEDELARASAQLERRPVPAVRAFEKLARYLVGRGYALEIARRATRDRLSRLAEQADSMRG
ncbi:regulatory protein RecX [Coriobacterium glomerans PW2]|uniref:Regulatory protein RecX n=1 Tax=Coriobacterium glomerans (strain ATCC 49209 / DSM 20642 / JCM 10262 / PW2) TaxID=700015 RepID=F2N7X9_CORGP|nr:regulatory protein RecX [Coriobacterium glomerans]AEB07088.1 regulatory protein RecX [Coriobacterium glomerans PW2]